MRGAMAVVGALLGMGVLAVPPAQAGPTNCDLPGCTPGITPNVVLGAPCDNTTYFVFGTAGNTVSFAEHPGRLLFCGSPRRFAPRWFRSPPMAGVKEENAECTDWPEYYVAQAPDGLFLTCVGQNGSTRWIRGDT